MVNQEQQASWLSKIFFRWVSPLMKKGSNQILQDKDLFELNDHDQLQELSLKLASNGNWQQSNFTMFDIIYKQYKYLFVKLIILSLLMSLTLIIGPIFINRISTYLNSNDEQNAGYSWIFALMVVFFLRLILTVQVFNTSQEIASKYLCIVELTIIKKSLKLTSAARRIINSSKILSMLTTDVSAIFLYFVYIQFLVGGPPTIIICVILIIQQIGWVGLLGPVLIIISLGLQAYASGSISKCNALGLRFSDKRQQYIKEFLQGIRILKYYAWEEIAETKVNEVRKQESDMIFKLMQARGILDSIYEITPLFITAIVFGAYVLLGNELNVTKTFTVVSLFMILQLPARQLSYSYLIYVNVKQSIKRINFFMEAEEISDEFYDKTLQTKQGQIILENCNFKWSSDYSEQYLQKSQELGVFATKQKQSSVSDTRREDAQMGNVEQCFTNLNLNINPGQFIGIIGDVGSGKSTLLSCLVNELHLESGRINIEGKIAYVPQQAWLRNTTIKENILFGQPYNESKYQIILDICELQSDIRVFAEGDMTLIGDKGVNLSGGQKQRISIARSLYQDADVYIFDDCISALDMYIGPRVFNRAFKDYLKGKTRLLATHSLYLLDQFDEIIIMNNLQISERGSYQQLLNNQMSSLNNLLIGFSQNKNQNKTLPPEKYRMEINKKTDFNDEVLQENEKSEKQLSNQSNQRVLKEELSNNSAPLSVYRNYFLGNSLSTTIFTITFFVISQILRQFSDWCVALWSIDYFNKEPFFYIVLCFGFSVLTGLSAYIRGYAFASLIQQSSVRIFRNMLHSLLRTPLWWFDITPIGRILNRCNKDQSEIDYQLPQSILFSYSYLAQIFFTLLGVSILNPPFWIIFLLSLILLYNIIRYFLLTNTQILRIQILNRSIFYSYSTELVSGISIIKCFGKEQMVLDQVHSSAKIYHKALHNQNIVNNWMQTRINIVCFIIIITTAIIGVLSKSDHNVRSNSAVQGLCMTWVYQAVLFLAVSIRFFVDQNLIMSGVQRILEYAENNPQEKDFDNPKAPNNWPSHGHIQAHNLVYKYRPELPIILKGVSFELKPKEKLGVCGRTGSGKSTITLGLLRILELHHDQIANNQQSINKENQEDIIQIQWDEQEKNSYIKYDGQIIENYGLHEIRKNVTIIPQDPVLFSGSIRFNIDPFNVYTDDELISALQKVQLWDQINAPQTLKAQSQIDINDKFQIQIPLLNDDVQDEIIQNKLQFAVEENGQNLSVGQRQLICLARAILRKSKILLMDEATASIDEKTDHIIQNMIKTEFRECTVISVAHRLNTIINYDRILVLKDGLVAEIDTPINLLENKQSHFYQMIESQGPDYINRMKSLISQTLTDSPIKQTKSFTTEVKEFFNKI